MATVDIVPDRKRAITEARGIPESEVFEWGLEHPCETLDLAQYPDGELDCAEAIEQVGRRNGLMAAQWEANRLTPVVSVR